jgi:hypothetical protein
VQINHCLALAVATQRFVEGEESGFESSEDEEVARGFFGRSRWPVYKQRREEQESRRERQTLCYIEKEGPLEAAIEDTVKRGGRGTSRREQQEKEELLAYVAWPLFCACLFFSPVISTLTGRSAPLRCSPTLMSQSEEW